MLYTIPAIFDAIPLLYMSVQFVIEQTKCDYQFSIINWRKRSNGNSKNLKV